MTKFTDWTPAQFASASLADLLELQELRQKMKAELAFHDAIFDSAMATQFKPNKFGVTKFERGQYKVKVDAPCRVAWGEGLGDYHGQIDGIRAKYDMTETSYKELDAKEKAIIRLYRTEKAGKVNYVIEKEE